MKTEPVKSVLSVHGRRLAALGVGGSGRLARSLETRVTGMVPQGHRQPLGTGARRPHRITSGNQAARDCSVLLPNRPEVGVTAVGIVSCVVMAFRSYMITMSYLSRNSDNEAASITFSA
jgi:hypothetical protein